MTRVSHDTCVSHDTRGDTCAAHGALSLKGAPCYRVRLATLLLPLTAHLQHERDAYELERRGVGTSAPLCTPLHPRSALGPSSPADPMGGCGAAVRGLLGNCGRVG